MSIGINPPNLHLIVLCTVKKFFPTHWNLPPNLYFFFRSCTLQRHLLFYRFQLYKNLFRALLQSPYGNQMNNDSLLIDVFILPLVFKFVNTIFHFSINIFTILRFSNHYFTIFVSIVCTFLTTYSNYLFPTLAYCLKKKNSMVLFLFLHIFL